MAIIRLHAIVAVCFRNSKWSCSVAQHGWSKWGYVLQCADFGGAATHFIQTYI